MKKTRLFKSLPILAAIVFLLNTTSIDTFAEGELTGKTATEIVSMMDKGWNMGNTFDATDGKKDDVYSQETSWGNPRASKELIHGVKAAGFNTIRIPVTWYRFEDKDNNYAIDEAFMARVTEIVDYAMDEGLFVIINLHHEKWVNDKDIDKTYVEIGKRLKATWSQIADNFADYDQHLIFEGMNEPRAQGANYEWTGNKDCYAAVNYLNDVFVNTIRSNGKGHNGERMLMIPGYAASSSQNVLDSIEIPNVGGKPAENICISVHCYSPYEFCLTDKQVAFDPKRSADTSDITRLMSSCKRLFIDNGIPVIIGECGCTNSGNNNDARLEWFAFFGAQAKAKGIPAIVWDNGAKGSTGGECHRYIDRKTGEAVAADLIEAFIKGEKEEALPEAADVIYDFEPHDDGTGKLVPMGPSDAGFDQKHLSNQAKINHTDGAKVGFSMKVDTEVEAMTVSTDISRFAGKNLKITAWVRSDEPNTVTMNVSSDEDGFFTVNTSDEWQELTLYVGLDEGRSFLSFSADEEKTYYVDDISIEMVDTLDVISDGSNLPDKTVNADQTEEYVDENGNPVTVLSVNIIIIYMLSSVVGVTLLAVLAILIGKRKKAKKKNKR